jgi:hypothetical protein
MNLKKDVVVGIVNGIALSILYPQLTQMKLPEGIEMNLGKAAVVGIGIAVLAVLYHQTTDTKPLKEAPVNVETDDQDQLDL